MSDPDAIRVWRGFRGIDLDTFFDRLGTVFVPATVELQVGAGLDAYLPSVPAALPGKPDTVPDETAILVWDSQQTYTDGFKRLAVRTYTLTHAAVYRPPSGADFPVRFTGDLPANRPAYLVDVPADWMHGEVTHLVGARPDGTSPDEFRASVAQRLAGVQASGAILCAADDYLVYWELGDGGAGAQALTGLCGWSHVASPVPTRLEKGLWDEWPGMTVASGDSFNMQFTRRWEGGR